MNTGVIIMTVRAHDARSAMYRMIRPASGLLMKPSLIPVPRFRHLQRLTDTVGLAERADGIMPRYGQGY